MAIKLIEIGAKRLVSGMPDKQRDRKALEDSPVSQAWLDEIRRRCKEIDSGRAKLLDGEAVIYELRSRYGLEPSAIAAHRKPRN